MDFAIGTILQTAETGFVLDWMKAYLVYSLQNVQLFALPFCLETEKSVNLSLVCM